MEYEQVERGRRIVMDAIVSQDINGYYDVLSPDVLLVTHFPYPSTVADCNVQAVRRWIEKSIQNHCVVAPAAGGGTANTSAAGSGGYATVSGNATTKTTGTSPVTLAGVGGAGSQKKRLRELLRRQAQWRNTGQQRYEAFRKRRERNHRCATGEVVDDDDASGTDGILRSGNVDARSEQASLQKDKRADGHKRRGLFNKSSSKDGRVHSEASAAAARAEEGIRWFHQQQQPQEPQQPGVRLQQPWSGEAPAALHSAGTSAGTQRTQLASGHVVSYEDAVSITEGRLLVSCRFFELLHWVASSSRKSGPTGQMLPVEVDLQLRKDILQEEEILPPPEDPSTPQDTFSQLGRQFTERNQPLSCMRVIWGAENLLFEDKIFFDDGLVVTIHRRMLTVVEVLSRWTPTVPPSSQTVHNMSPVQKSSPKSPPQQLRLSDKGAGSALSPRRKGAGSGNTRGLAAGRPEQVYQAVEVFYKPTDSRIDTHNIVWPLLDFSFVEATQPAALLRSTPVSGRVHVNQKPRPVLDPHAVQGVFLNQDNDPSKPDKQNSTRTLIKARNKLGEEEAYEFQVQKRRFSAQDDDGTGSGDGDDFGASCASSRPRNGNGASNGMGLVRYDASCVRISGCHLEERMDQLVPVLRRLVANCLLTLHTLDLSQNGISSLTDLRLLPLRNLRLHGNAIADWRVVESCIAPLPYLSILTLHGNPIAEDMSLDDNIGASGKAVVPDAQSARTDEGASPGGRTAGESRYWRRLLSLLLGNPARVVPLRQVDFVTLTGLEYNIAGAYEMFTTGRTGILAAARSMTRADGRCGHKVR